MGAHHEYNRRDGFTLIQISILLTVASLVLVSILPSTHSTLSNNSAATVKLESVLTGLRQFQTANGRLPCPADASQPIGATQYGVEAAGGGAGNNCTGGSPAANYTDATNHVAVGMVPVRALGLSNDSALDAYGRDITYAVDTHATTCPLSAGLAGGITITDNGSNNNTVAALVSHGADGHGAWLPLQGSSGTAVRLNAGSTDTDQLTNAHVSSSFSPTSVLTNFVKKQPTNTFDDLVVYKNLLWNLNTTPLAIQNMQPTVTPPPNGIYTTGQVVTFTLTYSIPITVTGIPRLTLTAPAGSIGTGNVAYANYTGGSGTTVLTFSYTVLSSDLAPSGLTLAPTVDVNGGTLTSCFVFLPYTNLSGVVIPPPCSAYAYHRAVTISHAQVSNTTQANFPVLISGIYAYLAQGNGNGNTASVSSATGTDIIFAASPTGMPMSFEQDSYNPSTGQANYWVRIPSLSPTTDTVIYMCYGNPSAASFQSTASTTWDSYYAGVWHLPNGATLSANDSTANANNGAIGGATATTGVIGGAGSFYCCSTSVNMGQNRASLQPANAVTVEIWVDPSTSWQYTNAGMLTQDYAYPAASPYVSYRLSLDYGNMGAYGFELSTTTASDLFVNSWVALTQGTWAHVVGTYDGSTAKVYVNGVLEASQSVTGNIIYSPTGYFVTGGDYNGNYIMNGAADEARVSSIARSADWIATEYNNQSSPGTFYSVGAAMAR